MGDDTAFAAAFSTGGDVDELTEEAAADAPHLAGAIAGVALGGGRAGLAGGAATALASLHALDCDLCLDAEGPVFEGQCDVDATVRTALCFAAGATGTPGVATAEKCVEDVAEAAEVGAFEPAADIEPLQAGVAEAVVGGALVGIGEHFVGLADLLELRFGTIFLVTVRVIFHGKATKGLLDLFGRSASGDADGFVVVTFAWHYSPGLPERQQSIIRYP